MLFSNELEGSKSDVNEFLASSEQNIYHENIVLLIIIKIFHIAYKL